MNRISGKLHADSLLKRGRDFIPVAILVTALFALLALSMWFAAYAWMYLGGDPIPAYGYVAMAGGVVISLVVGGGLMALSFIAVDTAMMTERWRPLIARGPIKIQCF